MPSSTTILSCLDHGVLTLTLNRPDRLNAINEEMHRTLREGLQRAHKDTEVRAILLTDLEGG